MHRLLQVMRLLLLLCIAATWSASQAPKALLDKLRPTADTHVETMQYFNSFDGAPSSALVELPRNSSKRLPLIVTPHGGNWTQEMNRSLWSGVANQFGAVILYPHHQGKLAPGVSLGSPKQLGNLRSAIAATLRKYPIDAARIYAAGLSQGAIESLLLAGRNPGLLAGVLAIKPIADMLAFHEATDPDNDVTGEFRRNNWHILKKVLEGDFGGPPETARAEYLARSPILYASLLATLPLILYWADNDELIGRGATHQGGLLAETIHKFGPQAFTEHRHSGGHGYPFFRVNLDTRELTLVDRQIFLDSVKRLLSYRKS